MADATPARSISTYLNHADVQALAHDRRRDPRRRSSRRCARRVAARRRSSRACTWCPRRTARATSTCCAATSGRSRMAGVKVVGDFYRNYERGLPSELARAQPVRSDAPACRSRSSTRATSPTCAPAPSPRSARAISRARARRCSATSARAARRTGTCACSIRSSRFDEIRVHSRRPESRDAFAARLRADLPGANDRRHRRLGVVRARRRHRRRGLAAREARAEAEDRVDREGRLRHSLRHDERGRALAHRHHGQDRHGRLGPGAGRPVRRAARARRQRAASRRRTCTPSSARSSPA